MLELKKLNQLPQATTYNDTDQLLVVQNGEAKQITRQTLFHGKTLPVASNYNITDLLYVIQNGVLKTISLDVLLNNVPSLEIDKIADEDGEFISLLGITSSQDQNYSLSTFNGTGESSSPKRGMVGYSGWLFKGMSKVKINGNTYWQPYYEIETRLADLQWYTGKGIISSSHIMAAYNAKHASNISSSLLNLIPGKSWCNLNNIFGSVTWSPYTGWTNNDNGILRSSAFEAYPDYTIICKFSGVVTGSYPGSIQMGIRDNSLNFGINIDAAHDQGEGGPYGVSYGVTEYGNCLNVQPYLASGVLALTYLGGSEGAILKGYRNGVVEGTPYNISKSYDPSMPYIQIFANNPLINVEAAAVYIRVLNDSEILTISEILINEF